LDIAPLYDMDAQRRKTLAELEGLQAERNKSADAIGRLKAQKGDVAAALKDVESAKTLIKSAGNAACRDGAQAQIWCWRINNLPDPSVPVGASRSRHKVMRETGRNPFGLPLKSSGLGRSLGILDFKTGTKSSGALSRFCAVREQRWSGSYQGLRGFHVL